MGNFIQSILNDLKAPALLHATWVHFPIALSLMGLVLLILLLLTRVRSSGVRWSCVLVYALATFGAYMAFLTGTDAASNVPPLVGNAALDVLHTHRELGEKAWIFLFVTTVFTACTAFRMVAVRATMMTLAIIAALTTVVWVGVTAHYGDALVYQHAIGTSAMLPMSTTQPTTMPTVLTPKKDHAHAQTQPAMPAQTEPAGSKPADAAAVKAPATKP